MKLSYKPVIGLEVHAEMQTRSKMFCPCPVVDATQSAPNIAVCPVCAGMPGVLPVVNQQAVEYALRVALALHCEVAHTSVFARKNYFYPDLPKGYQISQYEYPLAQYGRLDVVTDKGEETIRIRRVHLEEDTGKLTHIPANDGPARSLVDLNRAGVSLLEIVSEPDMHSVETVRAYATSLRSLLRYLGVNSGDMEKGVIRFEANVSIRPVGSTTLGTRVEIKNLNSFRALERSIAFEVERQTKVLNSGGTVRQETLGWDESRGETYSQRSKEEAHDYRYFPEPDLPPLVVEEEWLERVRAALPELPQARYARFQKQYELTPYDASLLTNEQAVADYFEQVLKARPDLSPKMAANWVLGELFNQMNQAGIEIGALRASPADLADLLDAVAKGRINQATGKAVLGEMVRAGRPAKEIIAERGLAQISDESAISGMVSSALKNNPQEVKNYLAGKETLAQWFFGQVMKAAKGQANPQVVKAELQRQLDELKKAGLI